MSEEDIIVTKKKSEAPRRRLKKIVIPKRAPSIALPEVLPVFITPDKTTCAECSCYPREDPYVKKKKLHPCLRSPVTLYELAAGEVDKLKFPEAFTWSEVDVARWIEEDVGLPQFMECFLDNHINGRRLLMLEDPSKLAELNIKDFEHMKTISSKVRELYSVEFVRFTRSISLPPRKPLTHCTWFRSRTGPRWGIHPNWTRCDLLRWMEIIMPEPIRLDHWDLVWYQKPEFPKVKIARIANRPIYEMVDIPHYTPQLEECREYMAPRRFKIQKIPDSEQFIWMERISSPKKEEKKVEKKVKLPRESGLMPKKINLAGLTGNAFVLAKRKVPKPKFLPIA